MQHFSVLERFGNSSSAFAKPPRQRGLVVRQSSRGSDASFSSVEQRSEVSSRNGSFSLGSSNLGTSNIVPMNRSMTEQISAHPDALKRRIEAEKRRQAREDEAKLVGTSKEIGWWQKEVPKNCIPVTSSTQFFDALEKAAASEQLVVAEFFAPHCMACKAMHKAMMKTMKNNPDVVFLQVNGGEDEARALCEHLGVNRLPFFHYYKNNVLMSSFPANLHKMDVIRAEIAAHVGTAPGWPNNQP